jgi:hypothetical protein
MEMLSHAHVLVLHCDGNYRHIGSVVCPVVLTSGQLMWLQRHQNQEGHQLAGCLQRHGQAGPGPAL